MSSGMDGTRLRAVEPSGKRVSTHRWQSILSRCDLPLPKKPLTHAARWFVWAMFVRNEERILWIPSAYCPSQTKVESSPRSSSKTLSSDFSAMRAWPLIDQGMGRRITLKDVPDLHDAPPALWIEIGTAM